MNGLYRESGKMAPEEVVMPEGVRVHVRYREVGFYQSLYHAAVYGSMIYNDLIMMP